MVPGADRRGLILICRPNQIEFFVATLMGAHTRVPLALRPYLADWTSDGGGIVYLSQGFTQTSAVLGTAIRIAKTRRLGRSRAFLVT